MGVPSPFHARTSALCKSYSWREWAGYHAVSTYEVHHGSEYEAIRHSAGLLDVTPLFKYDVRGRDAARLLHRVMTRSVTKLAVGAVGYGGWCDEKGLMMDDGTISRLGEQHFRLTANGPNLRWLQVCGQGMDVQIEETTEKVAALALQGPTSRAVLNDCCDADVDGLKFFRLAHGRIAGKPVMISRTGYTGDLGYEIWMETGDALPVWDAIMAAGERHGIMPVGILALDMARLEAGLILAGVDYIGSRFALTRNQACTPFEAGLGWTVDFKDHDFIGRAALWKQREEGIPRSIVGLMIEWEPLEQLYDKAGLPPQLPCSTWRAPVPVYSGMRQVGRATSGVWSPILKQNLALATIEAPHFEVGRPVKIEVTVDWKRHTVPAVVTKIPFYDPPRKKSVVKPAEAKVSGLKVAAV